MRFILFLILSPSVLFAQERMVFPSDVLSVITADWNKDGRKDRAVLMYNYGMGEADLVIYLGSQDAMVEHVFAPQIAWYGNMWGQQPSLTLNDTGSLLVHSLNIGIGRNRWEQTLTIAYRDEAFVVAGYTYSYHDSITPENYGDCDVNLLTGNGEVSIGEGPLRKFILGTTSTSLLDWNLDTYPKECFE